MATRVEKKNCTARKKIDNEKKAECRLPRRRSTCRTGDSPKAAACSGCPFPLLCFSFLLSLRQLPFGNKEKGNPEYEEAEPAPLGHHKEAPKRERERERRQLPARPT